MMLAEEVDIELFGTPSQLVEQINKINGLSAELDTADVNVVNVQGVFDGVSGSLILNIDADVTVRWGAIYRRLSSGSGSLISLTGNGVFEVVTGGWLETVSGHAIQSSGADASIIVSGGIVSANASNAIYMDGLRDKVTVTSDGTVHNNGTTAINAAIYMHNMGNNLLNVIVAGQGKVSCLTNTGYAIQTYGDVEISGNAQVSAIGGRAVNALGSSSCVSVSGNCKVWTETGVVIHTNGVGSNVIVSGGEVSSSITNANQQGVIWLEGGGIVTVKGTGSVQALAVAGTAIRVNTSGSVEVSGNAQVSATTGRAIYAAGTTTVTINGGFVFANGTAIQGSNNVIYSGGPLTINTPGVVVAWNNVAYPGPFTVDDTDGLIVLPTGATSAWDRMGSQSGISYQNDDNIGFFPISIVVVNAIDEFTVTYKANGGFGVDFVDDTKYGDEYEVLDIMFLSPVGFHFDGWNTLDDGEGTSYAVGSTITVEGDIVLFAQWVVDEFTVTYKANGGFGVDFVDDTKYGDEYEVLDIMFLSPVGFHFDGWNLLEDGTETSYTPSSIITIDDNIILFAQWTPDMYTVVYAPGSAGTWLATDETYTELHYGDTMPVFGTNTGATTSSSHNAGYTFTGWSPTVPSTVPDASTDTVTILTYTATWIQEEVYPDEFTVVYNGNGFSSGVVPVDSNSPYVEGSRVVVLSQGSMIRVGYNFLGWSQSSSTPTALFTAGSTFYIYEDITLYAVWSAIEYTVTYAPGTHGTFTTQTTKNLHYGDPTPTAPTVTGETGWTFTGWLPTPSTTVTTNITYTAQWKQEQTTTPPPTPTPSATPPTPSATPPTPTPSPSAAPSTPTPPVSTVTPTLTPTPTTSPPGTGDSPQILSVVNLVLSIAGIVLAVVVAMYVVLFKKKEAKTNSNYNSSSQNRKNKNDKDNGKITQYRTTWLITAIVLAVAGIVVFLLTEDMSRTMAITDKWTIINATIFIAEIITITLTFKHKKTKTNNNNHNKNSRALIGAHS